MSGEVEQKPFLKIVKPKSILFIDHVSVVGGAERSLIDLSRRLAFNGFKCSFIVPSKGELSSILNSIGGVHYLPIQSWRWWDKSILKLILSIPFQLITLFRLYRLIRRINPDLVHLNINRLVEPVVAARLARKRSVMHFRDIPSRIEKRFLLGTKLFFQIMNLADAWIANSTATYNDIISFSRVPVFNVANGIDVQGFLSKKRDSVPTNLGTGFRVVMIASLTPWKNIENFIELASAIVKRMNDVHFFIAGSGTAKYKSELEKKASDLGLSSQLTFLNKVEYVPALLSQMDVLVHTTINEPFGRVFVEAMLASKPVLTYRGGGADEIVEHGQTGFLIEPNCTDKLAEKLILLRGDDKLRFRLGHAGYRKAISCFSLDKHVENVRAVYKTLN